MTQIKAAQPNATVYIYNDSEQSITVIINSTNVMPVISQILHLLPKATYIKTITPQSSASVAVTWQRDTATAVFGYSPDTTQHTWVTNPPSFLDAKMGVMVAPQMQDWPWEDDVADLRFHCGPGIVQNWIDGVLKAVMPTAVVMFNKDGPYKFVIADGVTFEIKSIDLKPEQITCSYVSMIPGSSSGNVDYALILNVGNFDIYTNYGKLTMTHSATAIRVSVTAPPSLSLVVKSLWFSFSNSVDIAGTTWSGYFFSAVLNASTPNSDMINYINNTLKKLFSSTNIGKPSGAGDATQEAARLVEDVSELGQQGIEQ